MSDKALDGVGARSQGATTFSGAMPSRTDWYHRGRRGPGAPLPESAENARPTPREKSKDPNCG